MQIKKNTHKVERVETSIKRIIEEVVMYEMLDPKIFDKVEVVDTVLSRDFSICKVYVNIKNTNKIETLKALNKSAGFVKHAISDNLDLRKIPDIRFIYDEGIDKQKKVEELLKQIAEQKENNTKIKE